MMTFCFGGLIGGLLESDHAGLNAVQKDLVGMVIAALSMQGGFVLWIWFFLREIKLSCREAFGIEATGLGRATLWGIAGACIFAPVAVGLQQILGLWIELMTKHPAEAQSVVTALQKPDAPVAEQIFIGVWAVLVAPPAEEMLFRGVLYPTIKQLGFPRVARWTTALLFGAMHANLLAFLPLVIFALILIDLYEKTGSLWASITAHSLFNFINWLLLMLTTGPHPVIHFN
jgi:membrane protease YdiL (CAAX protease family)